VPPTSLPAGQTPSVAHKRVLSNQRARDMAIAHTHDHDAAMSRDRHHDKQGGQLCPPCPCLPGPAPSVTQKSAMPDRHIHAACRDRAWPHDGPGGANCAPMSLSARANAPASRRSARCWISAHAPPPALWRRSAAATTTYPQARNASATATTPIPRDRPDARVTPTTHTAGLLQAVQSTQHRPDGTRPTQRPRRPDGARDRPTTPAHAWGHTPQCHAKRSAWCTDDAPGSPHGA
jgi:hypothetical protein